MQKALQIYKKRLTNLTTKNRSLLLLRLNERQFIDVNRFEYLNNQPSFHIIESLIAQKKNISICSLIDSRDKYTNDVSAVLRKIFRTEKMVFEERGAKDLYVGYPFVEGKLQDDTLVRCPLLFFPVKLSLEQNQWTLSLRKDTGISFNKSLLLAFSHYNQITFNENFLEHDFSELSLDSQEFRTELYQLLKNSPLELHFNQSTFEDLLHDFIEYKKSEFSAKTETGKLKMTQEAVLGIFPQAGSYLIPDYDYLLKSESTKDIEDFFLSNKSEDSTVYSFSDKQIPEEELFTPYQLDASQERAIKSVKSGKSIVVQGPPGSGKSQMICNLIVDYISRGKNVLLVCQKKAALDVVYQRLAQKSFNDFVALVHDFKNDRKTIYENINRQIESLEKFKKGNNSLDAIYLERKFLQLSREIDQITDELEEFKTALYDTKECGLSIKELYLTSSMEKEGINLRREYNHFTFEEHDKLLRKLENYIVFHERLDTPAQLWYERVSFSLFSISDQQQIEEIIQEMPSFFLRIQKEVKDVIDLDIAYEDCTWIYDRQKDFLKLLELTAEENIFNYFKHSIKFSKSDYLWLSNRKKNTLSAFGKEGVETTLNIKELANAQEKISNAREASTNWYKKIKYRFFSKEKPFVVELLAANNLENTVEGLNMLMLRIDNRMNLEHQLSLLEEKKWLIDIPQHRDLYTLKNWFDDYLKAIDAKRIYIALRNGLKYLDISQYSYDELYKKIESLVKIINSVEAQRIIWLKYLTPKQIGLILNGTLNGEKLILELKEDFDLLCEYDKLKESIDSHEQKVIDSFQEKYGVLTKDTIDQFDNSLRIAWINHIETKYPILRSVSSEKIYQMETRLQDAATEKQELAKDIALLKARERTYNDVEYNRLNNLVTYRDLKHQVSKKRNIWPVRKLIQNFSHELLNLVPCWMGSPESVSAIFPTEEFFDLVIFDEASQCFAERGIPAMYRGKQVVICGDDQQLSPYDLYAPRWEEELENETALEVDSLLDLGKQYVPEVSLQGHYRSNALDLIQFSNQHFYKNRLQLIPKLEKYIKKEPSISYNKVEGVWKNNCNHIEAEKVVQLVKELSLQEEQSVGIITFNFKQQQLIQELLENVDFPLPRELFVKNIENVQGDEKNVIIFSIAYAPSPTGRMTAQFGALNQLKGENRLNVAITRAKEKIYLITSIYPQQLQVDAVKNNGPKLLQDYLQYAQDISNGRFYNKLPEYTPHNKAWFLKKKLLNIATGTEYQLKESVPFADLYIEKEKNIRLLLTDDNLYHESLSSKEMHVYLPEQLRSKGWNFKKLYSRNFWKKTEEFMADFYRFIES